MYKICFLAGLRDGQELRLKTLLRSSLALCQKPRASVAPWVGWIRIIGIAGRLVASGASPEVADPSGGGADFFVGMERRFAIAVYHNGYRGETTEA